MSQLSDITDTVLLQAMLNDCENTQSESCISTMTETEKMPSVMEINTGNNKLPRFIITAFVPDCNPKWLRPETYIDTNRVANWCGQFEECPETERLHVHLYVELKHNLRLRFNSIRKLIEDATGKPGNIARAKKCSTSQRQGAVNYVLKPNGRMIETYPFIWEHNVSNLEYKPEHKSTKPSKKDQLETQVKYIESKPKHWTWEQILHETEESKLLLCACSWGAKYHLSRNAGQARREIQKVVVLYGAGGTGKTTLAQVYDIKENEDFHQRYYKRNADDGKFWGGGRTAYRGQRIIHLEEFCGQETAANFKEICDVGKLGPSVNIKNGGTDLNHDTVIITSNHHPAAWYRKLFAEDKKQWIPICRRLTQVWFFPEKRPDGSLNIPDAEHPPYYVDQTEEFTAQVMIHDYERAKDHAAKHWPLPEVVDDMVQLITKKRRADRFEEYCMTGNF